MAKYKDLSVDRTNDLTPTGGFNEVGPQGMVTPDIKDASVVNETALNKMATSIPTPFARLYLYDTAFQELNAKENTDAGRRSAYKSAPGAATLYHHLAAECLDLLEFIFEYGNDKRFTIHEWDVNIDTKLLRPASDGDFLDDVAFGGGQVQIDPTEEKHKKLGKALQDAINDTKIAGTQKIYIFKWDGVIIGGTSPFTLVYTSPNWRRAMRAKKWKFYGAQGNELFAEVSNNTRVWPLVERSIAFRVYLYSLQNLYNNIFALPNGKLTHFYQYLVNNIDNYEQLESRKTRALDAYEKLQAAGLKDEFEKNFKPLKDTDTTGNCAERPLIANKVDASGVPFFTKIVKPDDNSAYRIKPTVNNDLLPVEENASHQQFAMKDRLPLVLSTGVLPNNAQYWYNTPYNPATLPTRPEGEYFERTLPGVAGNPQYPYLTESDFFEDKIMWLGYKVNDKKFFTGFDGECQFLLPLKPNFFKYFRVEDLAKMVKVTPENPPLYPKVTVTIDIPVAGGEIRFSRTYEEAKKQYVDFFTDSSFKLGIFPFYTYADDPTAQALDAYKVLLARKGDVALKFYNKDFVTPLGDNVVKNKVRTKSDRHNNVTEYFTLGSHMQPDFPGESGSFTAIRVIKDGIGGMVIPKFHRAKVSKDKYVFCVDFGTANTNIAYAKAIPTGTGQLRVIDAEIRTLTFGNHNPNDAAAQYYFDQMAMLNVEGSEGGAIELNKYINKEFVPQRIGMTKDDVKFPIRTRAWTRKNIQNDPELFGDTNIGFHTDKYDTGNNVVDENSEYKTKLKWGHNSRKLTGAFFREIVWMCKNKVAELGGDPTFEFFYTYPQTMAGIAALMKGWKEAALAVRCRANVLGINTYAANGKRLQVFEGLAPWYRAVSLPDANIFHTQDFLNVDIGGGSTDIIHVTKPAKDIAGREMHGYSFSAKFAAEDLWGDGVSGVGDGTNGFLEVFEKCVLPKLDDNKQQAYNYYKSNVVAQESKSADLISYLFSHKEFEFANMLVSDYKLRVPMLLHFAATIYYVARTLAMKQSPLPQHMAFSGMGSEYLKYITEDTEVLSDIIKAIFNFVGLKVTDKEGNAKTLNARFTENPKKITAEGGVLMFNTTQAGLTDKVINSEELNIHLYNGEDDEEEDVEITVGNVNDYKKATVEEVEKFLKLFDDNKFRMAVNRLEGEYPRFDVNLVKSYLNDGFDLTKDSEYPGDIPDTQVKSVLFFWPLKHAIYMLTKEMATQSINTAKANNQQ